jgi:hypothetical protein
LNRKDALNLLIKDGITVILFYFLARTWWSDEGWFTDKSHELLTFLLIGVIFYLISLGFSIITRPICIEITQQNKHYAHPITNFSIIGTRKTQEHERIVELTINVTKQNSVWHWIIGRILKKYNLSIMIESVTPGIILEADNEAVRNDITGHPLGFEILAHGYIGQIVQRSNLGTHTKSCEYLIHENPINFVSQETIHIVPILLANGNPAPNWLKLFIVFSTPEHVVNFRWEV